MTSPALGKIVEEYTEGENRIALVEFDGKRRAIYLNLVPEAHVGDCVRFHAGFATERIKPDEEGGCGKSGKVSAVDTEDGAETSPELTPETAHAYRLLSDLGPEQLRKLLLLAQEKQFAAGEIVFHSGDQSSFLHLIVSGEVILEEVEGNLQVGVQTLHAGDAMGWSALNPGARTHFQARALSHVSTIAFSGDQLRALCETDPAVGYALMKRLMELVTDRLDALRMKLVDRSQPARMQTAN